jgi:hypothetical protein
VATDWFPNGVDADRFAPRPGREEPDTLVFVGRMDYVANHDAMVFFCRSVLPRLWRSAPKTRLYIVGHDPSRAIQRLARDPRIVVTGSVPDVAEFVARAAVFVAPLRYAAAEVSQLPSSPALRGRIFQPRKSSWQAPTTSRALVSYTEEEVATYQDTSTIGPAYSTYRRQQYSDSSLRSFLERKIVHNKHLVFIASLRKRVVGASDPPVTMIIPLNEARSSPRSGMLSTGIRRISSGHPLGGEAPGSPR